MEAVMSIRNMLRSMPTTHDAEPVQVYTRNIQDYCADVARAQQRVDLAIAARAQADDELKRAQDALIAHMQELDMPFHIEATLYPTRTYVLED